MITKKSAPTRPANGYAKIMVFGVFDKLHDGHCFFIEEAKKYGHNLIIAVARDSVVEKIKGRPPRWHELKRMEILRRHYPDATVVLGDQTQGSYDVIKTHRPDVICVGYDQQQLKTDLEAKMSEGVIPKLSIIEIKAHRPEEYKSSKMV